MKQIALSIEQMKYLESLGLDTSDASMIWIHTDADGINTPISEELSVNFGGRPDAYHTYFPAYTLQDILEVLKEQATCYISHNLEQFWAEDYSMHNMLVEFDDDNILLNAYQILLWCIENNYIKTNK